MDHSVHAMPAFQTPAVDQIGAASDASLTATQKKALSRLHGAASQLEGVFLGMMLKEMRASIPESSLFGSSPTESTFNEMLDQQRAQSMAQSQTLGVGRILEAQLRDSVLQNAGAESQVGIPNQGGL